MPHGSIHGPATCLLLPAQPLYNFSGQQQAAGISDLLMC